MTFSIQMFLQIFLNSENFSQEFLCCSGGQVLLDNVMVLCAEINSGNLTTIKFTMNRENDSDKFILFTFRTFSAINLGFSQSINILLRDHKFKCFCCGITINIVSINKYYTVGFGPQIYLQITSSKLKARKLLD